MVLKKVFEARLRVGLRQHTLCLKRRRPLMCEEPPLVVRHDGNESAEPLTESAMKIAEGVRGVVLRTKNTYAICKLKNEFSGLPPAVRDPVPVIPDKIVVLILGKGANGVLSAICVLVVLKRRSCACQEGTERSGGHHGVTRNGVERSLQA